MGGADLWVIMEECEWEEVSLLHRLGEGSTKAFLLRTSGGVSVQLGGPASRRSWQDNGAGR